MRDLLGLPLDEALRELEAEGIAAKVVEYKAKREREGADDWRVLRAKKTPEGMELVVSAFCTVIL